MTGDIVDNAVDIVKLGWLTGPIFQKELLVASRRLRYYLLRTAYVMLLCCILAVLWLSTLVFSGNQSTVYRVTQMSAIARTTCSGIMWFQFITLQMLAIVMLSNSISDEVRKRTLDALASTPITSLQIVLGKLLSRLLQLILLLALSFPFLAIIRSFGGIPWGFLAGGLAITLTTTIFVGSITVWISIASRHAWKAIVAASVAVMCLYSIPPLLEEILRSWHGVSPAMKDVLNWLGFLHPFKAMISVSISFDYSRATSFNWPGHCLAVLCLSAVVMGLASFGVRRAIITAVSGASDARSIFFRRFSFRALAARYNQRRPVVSLHGNPIIWKDLPKQASRWSMTGSGMAAMVPLIALYVVACFSGWFAERGFHAGVTSLLVLIGLLRTATGAAAAIAAEKEARAWPILLCTPLDDRQIFWAKVAAVLRRTSPIWLLLFAHLVIFTLVGVLDLLNVVAVAVIILPALVFLLGTGMFFGLKLKTQTGAFVATLSLPIVLWFSCPCIGGFSSPIIASGLAVAAPMSLADVISSSAGVGILFTALLVVVPSLVYAAIGLVLGALAARTIRRNPF